MQKINTFLSLMLLIAITNLTHGQTVKTVYTIGSTFSVSSGNTICYPATPSAVQPPVSGNNYLPPNNATNNSYVVTGSTPAPIYDVIIQAYNRGFRHFYFQEGLYIVSTPINLDGLNGITIEGAGANTTFKPASASLEAIFKISNNYNSKILNLAIDLKTTLI